MGAYLTVGINNLDYPVIRSCVVVLALSFAVVMILVDLVFAFIDPRIKAQYESGGRRRKPAKAKKKEAAANA